MTHRTPIWLVLVGTFAFLAAGCGEEAASTAGIEQPAALESLTTLEDESPDRTTEAVESESAAGETAALDTDEERAPVEEQEAEETLDEETELIEEADLTEEPSNGEEDPAETTDEEEVVEEVVEEETTNEADSTVLFMPLSESEDVVAFVEIDRYMGTWYEIATTPSFQQAFCYGTTANYTFNEAEGAVDVVNTCYNGSLNGAPQNIAGKAEVVDAETQAKLSVFFFGQGAPYWVVALDGSEGEEPYAWAVVSVPGGQTMWLLSRTPSMDPEVRAAIEGHLEDRGFPVDSLIDTPQASE